MIRNGRDPDQYKEIEDLSSIVLTKYSFNLNNNLDDVIKVACELNFQLKKCMNNGSSQNQFEDLKYVHTINEILSKAMFRIQERLEVNWS